MGLQNHIGLLQKANLLSQKKGLAFGNFIHKFNIKTCAVFIKSENQFNIKRSIGFDGISIVNSKSTIDFWKGLIPEENKIYRFSTDQKNITPLFQFFSLKQKDEIDFISVLKNGDKILFLCNKELTDEISKAFDELDINLNYYKDFTKQLNSLDADAKLYKVKIDFEEAVRNFLSDNSLLNETALLNTISDEIQNRLSFYFDEPHFYTEAGITKSNLILNAKSDISFELIKSHVLNCLNSVLDTNTEKIEITDSGLCQSYSQITEFLQE